LTQGYPIVSPPTHRLMRLRVHRIVKEFGNDFHRRPDRINLPVIVQRFAANSCQSCSCVPRAYIHKARSPGRQQFATFFPTFFVTLFRSFRQPSCCLFLPAISGDEGSRTPDILLAKQALYQLSYVPDSVGCSGSRLAAKPQIASNLIHRRRVGVLGFEPRTSALSELRSSQLSYTPKFRHTHSLPQNNKAKPIQVWLPTDRNSVEAYLRMKAPIT
jgi:hypothetical protein